MGSSFFNKNTYLKYFLFALIIASFVVTVYADLGELFGFDSDSKASSDTTKQTPTDYASDWSNWHHMLLTLFLASFLGGLVSFRWKRAPNQDDITEAHVVLALSSTLMMMIIGSQIARAFGLMGAASIVRYRYSLKSPKEASSLIVALGIGMACGVGLYPLATVAAGFVFIIVNLFDIIPTQLRQFLFFPKRRDVLRIRGKNREKIIELLNLIKDDLGIDYTIIRIQEKGIEKDQVQIWADIKLPPGVDKGEITEALIDENIIRVRWQKP